LRNLDRFSVAGQLNPSFFITVIYSVVVVLPDDPDFQLLVVSGLYNQPAAGKQIVMFLCPFTSGISKE
jgi:hypothetical protein